KFGCELPDDNRLKVRYGRDNNEIFAGVAATRLFWALGFGADVLYPVHVICRGCPSTLHGDRVADGEARFDYAAIERKMPGREMEAPSVGPGWAWPELDRVDERAGGAPLAHRDALKLLAVMLQHTDNKAEQQKLICVDEDTSKHELGTCPATFMLIHDLGLTFGTATLVNSADRSSANLREWSRTPIWKDEAHCVANMPPSQSGTLINPIISEVGRSFLSDLLGELTDTQIQDLFLAARFGEKPGLNGESGGSVADWAAAFKRKRDEIAATSCFERWGSAKAAWRASVPRLKPSRYVRALLLFRNLQRFQVRDDVLAGCGRLHRLVDVRDLAGRIDVEGVTTRELALRRRVGGNHAVRKGHLLVRVREHREVGVLFLGERLVVGQGVDADHEVRRVELPNQSPALTERVAFGRSTGRERLREPRQHDPFALETAQGVGLAVSGLKGEVRRLITDLEFGRGLGGSRAGDEPARDDGERQQAQHLPHKPPLAENDNTV